MTEKKTIIIGASPKPDRYAHMAANRLNAAGHPIVQLGWKKAEVAGQIILTDWPRRIEGVHTITLYINPKRQEQYYDYILNLEPKRIIFNPGTVNPELMKLANKKKIKTEAACTLVMLSASTY